MSSIPQHLRHALPTDSVDGVVPENIAQPESASELATILKISREAGRCVVPRGSGSKLAWGNPPKAAHLILSTHCLNHVVEHAWGDMTATVEAGCVFADLENTLSQRGQRLALDPLWPERSTIGGILATNDSGALRTRFGSLRDLIIGVTLALPDGTLAKSGGKVVKNVAGYDLAKLATGSLGTLGVITQAIFRLHPVPRCSRSLSFIARDNQAMMAAVLAILDSQLTPSAIQIRVGSSSTASVDVLLEGTSAGCDAQTQQVVRLVSVNSTNESDDSVWNARKRLFAESPAAAVCKVSLLPAEFGIFSDYLVQQSQAMQFSWTLIAQAVGVGLLRLVAASIEGLRQAVIGLRKKLESSAGSLVILQCPRELKTGLDVWGSPGDALPLMKSIKARFDPTGVLNPGRFVGAI
ncbi:MAG: FAD-binding oxidoreductase [Sciscionella sp.]